MANKISELQKILCALILVFAFCLPAFSADEKRFSQRLEWKADKNAYEYRVELKSVPGKKSTFYPTDKTFLDLQLKPGKYTYRVYVYDLLGREAAVSAWTDFEILKASQPEIASPAKEAVMADDDGKLSLDVDIEGINEESVVELVADPIQGKIVSKNTDTESEVGSASKVEFSEVPAGKWRLRVTNPSGLSSESDVIEVQAKPVIVEVPIEVPEEIPVETEIAEEKMPEIPPEIIEEEEPALAISAEEKSEEIEENPSEKIEPPKPEKEEKPKKEKKVKEPKPKKEKPVKPPRPPYVCKDINVMLGFDFMTSVLNTMESPVDDVFDNIEWGLNLRASYFPIKTEKGRWGGELVALKRETQKNEMFYDSKFESTFIQANLVYQKKFLTEKTFIAFKGGFGTDIIDKRIEYFWDKSTIRDDSIDTYVIPTVQLGLSIFAIPMKFLVAEVGVDYTHTILGLKSCAGFVSPYIAIGFRF